MKNIRSLKNISQLKKIQQAYKLMTFKKNKGLRKKLLSIIYNMNKKKKLNMLKEAIENSISFISI